MPSTRSRPASRVAVWAAILTLYVVWGSTYLAIRVGVAVLPPFVMTAVRFAIAGIVMLAVVGIARRRSLTRPSRREVRDSAIVGTCFMFGGMGLVSWGEQTVPSGIAGVLVATMPVWVAVYGRAFFGERLPGLAYLGIGVGIVGVIALVGTGVAIDRSLDPAGILVLIVSPMTWAAGSTYSARRAHLPADPFLATGLEMFFGSIVVAFAAVATGEVAAFRPETVTLDAVLATGYLTVVGSLVALTAFNWAIRHAPLPLVTTYAFVNPVIAVFLGALLLHETVGPVQLVAGAVIIGGVAMIILARSRMPAPTPAAEGDSPSATTVAGATRAGLRVGAAGRIRPG